MIAKQVLCGLSHIASSFCCGYFGDGRSHKLFVWAGLEPISASGVARITGVRHWLPAEFLNLISWSPKVLMCLGFAIISEL
jgi:hypothetical protein